MPYNLLKHIISTVNATRVLRTKVRKVEKNTLNPYLTQFNQYGSLVPSISLVSHCKRWCYRAHFYAPLHGQKYAMFLLVEHNILRYIYIT